MDKKPKYYNESRNKATQRYLSKNLEQVRFYVRKGEKDALKEEARRAGQSLAQYAIQAINERAGRQLLTPSASEQETKE